MTQPKPNTLLEQFRHIRAEMNQTFGRIEARLPSLSQRLDLIEHKLGND